MFFDRMDNHPTL